MKPRSPCWALGKPEALQVSVDISIIQLSISVYEYACFSRLVRSRSGPSPGLTTEERQEHC